MNTPRKSIAFLNEISSYKLEVPKEEPDFKVEINDNKVEVKFNLNPNIKDETMEIIQQKVNNIEVKTLDEIQKQKYWTSFTKCFFRNKK